ncbi:hypothetical protein E4U42_004861 [Claviceps africana]|uniref:Uncharacterized protein n=1 Tax=Claviceps africana TaxID=83212 RepID=A0A8K0J4H7_9HYPO|nr:hypothetical protein E4U42_004861 [Claviceps africana]
MSTLSEPRRPRLLPQNRKLRHLKGLSLRNLSFAPATSPSAHPLDDAAAVGSPNKPKKLGKLHETGQLQSSPSSENLHLDRLRSDSKRPRVQPRRSSWSLVHASPLTRQKNLESLVDRSVGDVFFSLHVPDCDEPVYISEVRSRSANFDFQFFHLSSQPTCVSRACILTIRVWCKRPQQASWAFLLEEVIDLRRLNFIGTLIDRQFPPNALLFHLQDGLYSIDFPARIADPKPAPLVASSSYNALMKLANLESSVQDAIDTQRKIMQQINEILEQSPPDPIPAADEAIALADKYVLLQRRANRAAETRRHELRESLRSRREAIAQGRQVQALANEDIQNNSEKLAACVELVRQTEQQIHGQRRRICSELCDIFPITPVPNAPPLSFQICNLHLPNSLYDAATAKVINEDVLSAALGLVAMLTRNLQFYLSSPLPYPLFAYGSRSYARDDISHIPDAQAQRLRGRDFPLYLPRGGSTVGQWRFEYGWFLLNKNIEALCASEGLKVVDIRHSLPNLKYLLYVCSAGRDEVPERKKGGIRGLWAGKKLNGRPHGHDDTDLVMPALSPVPVPTLDADGESGGSSTAGSRRASADSEMANRQGDSLRSAMKKMDNDGWGNDSGVGLPFGDESAFTLRTSGLRESIAQ